MSLFIHRISLLLIYIFNYFISGRNMCILQEEVNEADDKFGNSLETNI